MFVFFKTPVIMRGVGIKSQGKKILHTEQAFLLGPYEINYFMSHNWNL